MNPTPCRTPRARTRFSAVMTAGLLALLIPGGAQAASLPELFQASYDLEVSQDYEGALARMDEIAEEGAGYVVHLRRGWLLYLLGRYPDATAAYQRAITAQPESVEARQGLVLPLMALKRWTEAQAACEALLRLAPTDYRGNSRLAYVHYNMGQYTRAAELYRLVLVHYPSDVEMQAGLGWALLKDGHTAEARTIFEAVLQVAPSHVSAGEGRAASATGALR